MCLIVFAWKLIPGTPLIVASNRDEYYDRPAAPAAWWEHAPQVFGGRDLKSGGTWMGIAGAATHVPQAVPQALKNYKFSAITNIRAPLETRADAPSRGTLVADFLTGHLSPEEYISRIKASTARYNGFNLLVGDQDELLWFSNRHDDDHRNGLPLAPGIYGISNAALDTPWTKVVKTKAEFASLICQGASEDAYFEMLSNTIQAPDCRLPDTGVSFDMERLLSSPCIKSASYGTRVSSLLKIHNEHPLEFVERILR